MPIYEYACDACGHMFERKQRFSDDPVSACPECDATVRRVLHPAGIVFKGSGWYVTDSRKSNNTSNGSESSEKASESSDKTSSSKDTATAAADD